MQVYSFHGLRLSERRLAKPAMTVAACTTYAIGCSNHGHGGGRKEASQRRAISVGRSDLGTIRAITMSRFRSSEFCAEVARWIPRLKPWMPGILLGNEEATSFFCP